MNYSYDYNTATDIANSSGTMSAAFWGFFGVIMIAFFVILIITIISQWKIFQKAGKPGWAAIVPIYNIIVLLDIVNRPTWWVLLFFVPFVNFVVAIMLALDVARAFGKSDLFGIVGLILFPIIGYPMLAFGDAKYTKPKSA